MCPEVRFQPNEGRDSSLLIRINNDYKGWMRSVVSWSLNRRMGSIASVKTLSAAQDCPTFILSTHSGPGLPHIYPISSAGKWHVLAHGAGCICEQGV